LVWTQAPFGYGCSLIIGGLFFAKKMREQVVDSELTALKQLLRHVSLNMNFLLRLKTL